MVCYNFLYSLSWDSIPWVSNSAVCYMYCSRCDTQALFVSQHFCETRDTEFSGVGSSRGRDGLYNVVLWCWDGLTEHSCSYIKSVLRSMILSLFLSRGLGKSRAHKNLKTKKVFYHNSKTHQSSIPNTRKSNRYRKNINVMPRTVYPADSASQVSTNRGSLLGRQPGQQGHRNQNDVRTSLLGQASARGIQGSALGRSADTNLRPRGKSSITNAKLNVELELTRLVRSARR